jgi:hypothetical protein
MRLGVFGIWGFGMLGRKRHAKPSGCEMLERCSDEMKLGEFSSINSWKARIMGRKALHFR